MPGPMPKREQELARPRSRKGKDEQPTKKGLMRKVTIPRADPTWHPIAKMFYDSLKKSGQADFFQQSDWALAYSIAEDLSQYKSPLVARDGTEYVKRSGQMLATIYAAMERLLVAEGDRRRVRIELETPEPEGPSASVTAISDYRAELGLED